MLIKTGINPSPPKLVTTNNALLINYDVAIKNEINKRKKML